jgi:TonB family protein
MKTRSTVFDHDLAYGRDIRIAGIAALVLVAAEFLFVPQLKVEPYRLRAPAVDWTLTIENPAPFIYVPPKPVEPAPRGIPMASDNPEALTVAKNTSFDELKVVVTETKLEAVDFIKVERRPELIRKVIPDYPEMARAAGIEGKVVVSMVVDILGNVAHAEVYATSGNSLLDRAAVEAALKCGFTPGFQRDRPVVVRNVILPFNFRLH